MLAKEVVSARLVASRAIENRRRARGGTVRPVTRLTPTKGNENHRSSRPLITIVIGVSTSETLTRVHGVRKAKPSLCGITKRHRSPHAPIDGMECARRSLRFAVQPTLPEPARTNGRHGVRKAQPSLCGTNRRYRSLRAPMDLGSGNRTGWMSPRLVSTSKLRLRL